MNTVITHFRNEEYLLPWWINHHKKIFDHGIMINYGSTDRSIEICKELCPPHWKIVNTVNDKFIASLVDAEVKVYENSLEGFKMALTITEFLLIPCPLDEINKYFVMNNLKYLRTWGVCMGDNNTNILPTYDRPLVEQKHHGVIRNYLDPSCSWGPDSYNAWFGRCYHNQPFGKYIDGRHNVDSDGVQQVNDIFTLKYKYCPWNKFTIERINNYESIVEKCDLNFRLWDDEERNSLRNHYLNSSHDLKEDMSFNAAYNYCMSL